MDKSFRKWKEVISVCVQSTEMYQKRELQLLKREYSSAATDVHARLVYVGVGDVFKCKHRK